MAGRLREQEALDILSDAPPSEKTARRQELIGERAIALLRDRGEIVFVTGGMWARKTSGAGGADKGSLFTQATRPVSIGDQYVALRDKLTYPKSSIELVCLDSGDPEDVRYPEKARVLASLSPSVVIPGVLHLKEGSLEAVDTLLDVLENGLEPLTEQMPHLPQVTSGETLPNMTIDLRANPEQIGELITSQLGR